MTPYEIDILLHYHCRGDDHPDMLRNPPVWQPTIQSFLSCRLVEHTTEEAAIPRTYQLAERGEVYVNALLAVPLPVQVWVMPETPKEPKP